ncbi:MCE family protein [Rhodococcus erythropolis]|nr:MCE family protein [Rhodococcus erythropolis]
MIVGTLVGALSIFAMTAQRSLTSAYSTCAIFRDAVGLYPGNKVAVLGVEIGTVDTIENLAEGVKVSMTIESDVRLPADVGAATVSTSIVNDRQVEFTHAYGGGPELDAAHCIAADRTKTPRTVTEFFTQAKELSDDITEGGTSTALSTLIGNLNATATGQSDQLRQIIGDLSAAAEKPQQLDADVRALIENIDTIAAETGENYDDVRDTVNRLADTLWLINHWADEFAQGIDYANELLPIVTRAIAQSGGSIEHGLGATNSLIQLLATNAEQVTRILERSPSTLDALIAALDKNTGAVSISLPESPEPPR